MKDVFEATPEFYRSDSRDYARSVTVVNGKGEGQTRVAIESPTAR